MRGQALLLVKLTKRERSKATEGETVPPVNAEMGQQEC